MLVLGGWVEAWPKGRLSSEAAEAAVFPYATHAHTANCSQHTLNTQLMNNLDFKAAVGELKAAVDYLRASGSKKVCVCVLGVAIALGPSAGGPS